MSKDNGYFPWNFPLPKLPSWGAGRRENFLRVAKGETVDRIFLQDNFGQEQGFIDSIHAPFYILADLGLPKSTELFVWTHINLNIRGYGMWEKLLTLLEAELKNSRALGVIAGVPAGREDFFLGRGWQKPSPDKAYLVYSQGRPMPKDWQIARLIEKSGQFIVDYEGASRRSAREIFGSSPIPSGYIRSPLYRN